MTVTAEKKTPPAAPGGFKFIYDPSKVHTDGIYHRNSENQERFREERTEKYRNALNSLPQRGGGLHSALMSVCNLGVSAGIPDQILLNEITATGRKFKRGEVAEAIEKAELLGVSLPTVNRMMNDGRLQKIKLPPHGTARIAQASVKAFLHGPQPQPAICEAETVGAF